MAQSPLIDPTTNKPFEAGVDVECARCHKALLEGPGAPPKAVIQVPHLTMTPQGFGPDVVAESTCCADCAVKWAMVSIPMQNEIYTMFERFILNDPDVGPEMAAAGLTAGIEKTLVEYFKKVKASGDPHPDPGQLLEVIVKGLGLEVKGKEVEDDSSSSEKED